MRLGAEPLAGRARGVSSLGSAAASAIFRPRPRSGAAGGWEEAEPRRGPPTVGSGCSREGLGSCLGWGALGSAGPRSCLWDELSSRPGSAAAGPRGGVCWREG